MGFMELLDHFCDIYHIEHTEASPGYGLPPSPSFGYPLEPDVKDLTCHFSSHSDGMTISQKEPFNELNATMKLTLPIGTDIRLNDKIIDCANGLAYTASIPRNIRGHHLLVHLHRTREQRAIV